MLDAGRAGPLPAIANSRRFKLCAALAYCASSSTGPLHVTGKRRGLPTPHDLPRPAPPATVLKKQKETPSVSAIFFVSGLFRAALPLSERRPNVRFTPKSGHCIARQRMSALCQKQTFCTAVQNPAIRSPRRRAQAASAVL